MRKQDVYVSDYCYAHGLDPKRVRERLIANGVKKVGGRWLVNANTRPFLTQPSITDVTKQSSKVKG